MIPISQTKTFTLDQTKTTTSLLAVLFLSVVSALPSISLAQSSSSLDEAESSFSSMDYEDTLEQVHEALVSGQLNPETLARAYEIAGIAAVSLGQTDRAHQSFLRLLALRPDAELDRTLSPRLRAPFLDARGYWSTHRQQRLGFEVELASARGALRIAISDPLSLGQSVVVRYRLTEDEEYEEAQVAAEERTYVEIGDGDEVEYVEYSVQLLDEHGNQLVARGDDEIPESAGETSDDRPVARSAWFWVVMGVAVAAIGGGVALGVVLSDQSEDISMATDVSYMFDTN